MLETKRAFCRVVAEIALMLVYWSVALLAYGAKETTSNYGQGNFNFSDIGVALLFSVGFLVLARACFVVRGGLGQSSVAV